MTLKARYAAAGKQLQGKLAPTEPRVEEVLGIVDELEVTVKEYIALVPTAVIQAVRERERKLALASSLPNPAPAPALAPQTDDRATQDPSAAPQVGGGLLVAPSRTEAVCGVNIRC